MRTASAPSRLAAATPPDRDRFVDLLRVASIAVVVLGHWTMAAIVRRDGAIRADNALAYAHWFQPATWLLQVMPVFFVVLGYTNARALSRPGASAARLCAARLDRLALPVSAFAAAWLIAAAALLAGGVQEPTAHDLARVAGQPLWFLAVYLLLVLVAPAQFALRRRRPWAVVVALPPVAVVLDVLRLTDLAPAAAILNYLAVFMVAQEIGFHYADGRLQRLPRSALLGAAGGSLAALTLLTTLGPYPVSMVGVPGESMSNMSPPTVCLLLVTVLQMSLLLLARPRLERLLQRPAVWRTTVAGNTVVLSVFLWHLTAFGVVAAAAAGIGAPLPRPASAAWWLAKPAWLLAAGAVLALLVAAVAGLEHRGMRAAAAAPRAAPIATLLTAVGLAGLAASGFTHPFTASGTALVGIRFSPAVAAALLAGGLLLSRVGRDAGARPVDRGRTRPPT
jgi:fucose 4-O-acetylase-like acetyltransferase